MASAAAGESPEKPAKFVVHEWGVHIRTVSKVSYEAPVLVPRSMGALEMKAVDDPAAPSRGVLLPPEELISGLPAFVLRHSAEYKPSFSTAGWDKPVLHFYGREGAEVSVQVLIPQGRPLAYWPRPTMVEKRISRKDLHPMGVIGPELLGLAWKGRLSGRPAKEVAEVRDGHWWKTVRAVPSLWFNTESGSERFVFYEATALQELPLVARVGAQELTLENTGTAGTGPVVVIVNDGRQRSFLVLPDVAGKTTAKVGKKQLLAADGDAERLLAACRAQWESFGMTAAEARAIVETWKPDLLDRRGFLVASRVPAEVYERMFPLTVSPQPDELVRAGVVFDVLPGESGRIGWLPAIGATFEKWAADLAADKYDVREEAMRRFRGAGDLADSFLEKLAKSDDAEVSNRAESLLKELRSGNVVMPAGLRSAQPSGARR